MTNSEMSGLGSQPPPPKTVDLEKADHAAKSTADVDEADGLPKESRSSNDEVESGNLENEALSGPTITITDDEDPFALFPTLSVSMSSTRAPWARRNTASTLGRRLTRAETLQTIKTVRSRFNEARSEFDENVRFPDDMHNLIYRMIYPNSLPLTTI
jgi:hypothetical protein